LLIIPAPSRLGARPGPSCPTRRSSDLAVGVGPGDEVVLPANTFIATAEAVARAGATPVLVDCDPEFLLIDTDAAAARIGARTKRSEEHTSALQSRFALVCRSLRGK